MAVGIHIVRVLRKDGWRFAIGFVPYLNQVHRAVAADARDPAHRRFDTRPRHWKSDNQWRYDHDVTQEHPPQSDIHYPDGRPSIRRDQSQPIRNQTHSYLLVRLLSDYAWTNMENLVDQLSESLATLAQREPSDRTSAIVAVRAFIEAGGYVPGDRLPPERVLIGELGVSRGTLRRALDSLERDGLIWRHVGKGTFVSEHGGAGQSGAVAVLSQQMTPVRVIQARLCIEPSLAREAAIHASRQAINRIKLAKDAAVAATGWADYEAQDDLFHRAVAEASDNILLLTLFDQLNHVRRAVAGDTVVRGSSRPPRAHSSFAEHERISAAIEARDPEASQQAMRRHIGSVSDRLFGEM